MQKSEFYSYLLDMQITANAKLVCFILLHHYNNKTGDCYPSMETIAMEASLCRNSVARAIKELSENNVFTIKKKRILGSKFTSNYYIFDFQCSLDAQSNEQSNERSNERSPDAHKPIITNITNKKERSKESIYADLENPPSIQKKYKGSRFELTELPSEWIEFCQTQRPDLNVGLVFDGFRDYWIAKAGKDGIKLDWTATWRNWIRRQNKQTEGKNNEQSKHDRAKAAILRGLELTQQREQQENFSNGNFQPLSWDEDLG